MVSLRKVSFHKEMMHRDRTQARRKQKKFEYEKKWV